MEQETDSTIKTPLTPEELHALPVFPLPRMVFFPRSVLPLHLFEDRYRKMIEDCMSTGPQAMAVSLIGDSASEFNRIACAGRIVSHNMQADGTHDIILQGLQRVSLSPLDTDAPYITAKATILPDLGTASDSQVRTMMTCAMSLISVVREQHPEFSLNISSDDTASAMTDIVADRLISEPSRRQVILQAQNIEERLELVIDSLGDLLALLAARNMPC